MSFTIKKWYDEQLEIVGGDGSPEQKRLVMLWTYTDVLHNIYEGIRQANADHEEISAVLNYYNPEGSTRYVFRPTNQPVLPTEKSHVNFVIGEPESWQDVARRTLDKMESVEAWVRNTYLGFRIPYSVGDEQKEYVPDLIVRVRISDERSANVIVECHDFDNDNSGNKETKRHFLTNYWLPAANGLKTYGEWHLLEVHDIEQLERAIKEKIQQL